MSRRAKRRAKKAVKLLSQSIFTGPVPPALNRFLEEEWKRRYKGEGTAEPVGMLGNVKDRRDALLIYRDGTERHVKLPESLSAVPEPPPSHILISADGDILAYLFKGSDFGLPIDETDSIMARDPETPDECPVYRET